MTYRNFEGYADPTAGKALAGIEREKHGRQYRPMVYICSKYAGDVMNNIISARDYCRFAAMSGYIPVASHLLFTQFLHDENPDERRLGLFFGNILMDKCDEVWIFGVELSAGMKAEYDRAKRKGYKIRRFTTDCREVTAHGH
jgi:hypothetical protein